MSVFYSSKKSSRDQIYGNYLSEFIIKADHRFRNENHFSKYASLLLSCMIRFGNWLEKRKIPLESIDFSHVTKFLSTFPASTSKTKMLITREHPK